MPYSPTSGRGYLAHACLRALASDVVEQRLHFVVGEPHRGHGHVVVLYEQRLGERVGCEHRGRALDPAPQPVEIATLGHPHEVRAHALALANRAAPHAGATTEQRLAALR